MFIEPNPVQGLACYKCSLCQYRANTIYAAACGLCCPKQVGQPMSNARTSLAKLCVCADIMLVSSIGLCLDKKHGYLYQYI